MKLMILDEARPKIMNRSGWSWLNLTDWTDSVPVPEERYLSFIEKRKLKNKNANGESNQINNRSARGFLRKSRRSSWNSSVGRALDWRSKGPWFDPGFRQWFCAVCTLGKGFQCCHYLLLIITYHYLSLLTITYDFAARGGNSPLLSYSWQPPTCFVTKNAVGRIRTYAPKGNLISSQTP